MDMTPSVLPDKLPDEKVAIYLRLATAIDAATITSAPTFVSDPTGLTFTGSTLVDSSQTAMVLCEGGTAGQVYVVSALCSLSTGEIVQPVVALPVVTPAAEVTLPSDLSFTPIA